ncbi:putative expansin-B2 [Turnera subulata]|uniref:Expansin-B2 n=1 Tax=Turnera subulata TaxID=218843 RepID=A0A9Q0FXP2_9ROSI|nr:putative expansin-B2 [Turnera subulata]
MAAACHPRKCLIISLVLLFLFQTLSLISCRSFNSTIRKGKYNYPTGAPAVATWYGDPYGAGSEGGACGFGKDVSGAKFAKMVSAGGPSLYLSGKGCGACYQVKCASNPSCSRKPVTVVITDSCPGCPEAVHFDLSGTAFGALAKPGQDTALRNAGILQIQYKRVPCKYPGTFVTFHIDSGSNPYYFAVIVEYVNGDGEVASLELKEASGNAWRPMQRLWGVDWKLDSAEECITAYLKFYFTVLLVN